MQAAVHAPKDATAFPRLLLGATLMLWGGINGRPLVGLIVALIVEGAHWTRTRWDFNDNAYVRAWQAVVILLLMTTAFVWLNASAIRAMPEVLSWMPIVILPLQFTQSYGLRRRMSLVYISAYLRKRREYAHKHGLPFRDIYFDFSNIYFLTTLISTTVGEHVRTPIFFPAVVVLIFWLFLPAFRRRGKFLPIGALVMMLMAVLGGLVGEQVLDSVYRRLGFGRFGGEGEDYARQTLTAIGDLGEVKQSSRIQWRLIPHEGGLPDLLRIASYNTYHNTYWKTTLPPAPKDTLGQKMDVEAGMFEPLRSPGGEQSYYVTARTDDFESVIAPDLPRYTIRGQVRERMLFPIPDSSGAIIFPKADPEINPFGTLRVEPSSPAANTLVVWNYPMSTGMPPWHNPDHPKFPLPDLDVPDNEQTAVTRFVNKLGIRDLPLEQKVAVIRNHFNNEFTYSRYLELPSYLSKDERNSFVSIFLEQTKRGHCEYFATSAVFLLRECGIPARYATGYAVLETDGDTGEALIRGSHAHAWAMAWDESKQSWINVDVTPPDWSAIDAPRMSRFQWLIDRWQLMRDNILVWRSESGNLSTILIIVAVPVLIGGSIMIRRLWKSKRRIGPSGPKRSTRTAASESPLGKLEKPARLHLGERSPHTPLARWLSGLSASLDNQSYLDEAIRLHLSLRFDPDADTDRLRNELDGLVDALHKQITKIPHNQAS